MSDSTEFLDTISSSVAQKEVIANALFAAMSTASLFGRRAQTSVNLTWGYYGGYLDIDGTLTAYPDSTLKGTIACTANQANHWICGGRIASSGTNIDAGSAKITVGSNAVINVTGHTFAVGDVVYISGVSGMTQINGVFAEITAVAANTITTNVNTTGFTAHSSGGTLKRVTDTAGSTWQQGKALVAALPPGLYGQYLLVTGSTTVTSYKDYRITGKTKYSDGILRKAMSDANQVLTTVECMARILEFTGTLTAARNITLPNPVKFFFVFNNTTGGYSLNFKTPAGATPVEVTSGSRMVIYSNGSEVVAVTAALGGTMQQTQFTVASGAISAPQFLSRVPATITLLPGASITGTKVQFSTASVSAINTHYNGGAWSGTAVDWFDWDLGSVTTDTYDSITSPVTALRVTATGDAVDVQLVQ